jgi:hypothetical protein
MPRKRTLIAPPLALTAQSVPVAPLYQTFLYDWLDRNGHGRYLADGDL